MKIDSSDRACRYLPSPGGQNKAAFWKLLEKVGLTLPSELTLRDTVRLGWIEPVLRVEIPKRFFLAWKTYPTLGTGFDVAADDQWADELWGQLDSLDPFDDEDDVERWSLHPLDRDDLALTRETRRHAVPTGPDTIEPQHFRHRRSQETIYPWIDYFAYWQIYELAEVLEATVLVEPLRNVPHVKRQLTVLRRQLPRRIEHSSKRIAGIRRHWLRHQPVFEWLSRYRTLLATWGPREESWRRARASAMHLLAELGLTPGDLKVGVRDTLLTIHARWDKRRGGPPTPKLMQLLEEDIERAISLWQLVAGQPVDPDDETWGYTPDRWFHGWTPLPDAFPREDLRTRAFFYREVLYLRDFNAQMPPSMRFEEEVVKELVRKWWPRSVAFRRFSLALTRAHQHYRGERERMVRLWQSTPMEFLIAASLHVDRIVGERLGGNAPGYFFDKLGKIAPRVIRSFRIRDKAQFLAQLKAARSRGNLKTMPSKKTLFAVESDFAHPEPRARLLLTAFVNAHILRNYAAHHDSLDRELIYEGVGVPGIVGLLVVTLSTLKASR